MEKKLEQCHISKRGEKFFMPMYYSSNTQNEAV